MAACWPGTGESAIPTLKAIDNSLHVHWEDYISDARMLEENMNTSLSFPKLRRSHSMNCQVWGADMFAYASRGLENLKVANAVASAVGAVQCIALIGSPFGRGHSHRTPGTLKN